MLLRRMPQCLSANLQHIFKSGHRSIHRSNACAVAEAFPQLRRSVTEDLIRQEQNAPSIEPVAASVSSSPEDMLKHPDYFNVRKLFTIKDLFQAGVHLGHMEGTLNDRMRQFMFGKRFNQLVIDLDQTAECLRDALNVLSHIVYRGGIVLFVCRHRQNGYLVEQMALEAGEYSHTRYWKGGVLTNSTEVFQSVTRLPDLLVFVSTLNSVLEQHLAVDQAALMNIPTIGIVDTNCNPNLITYPIPGNDDSPATIAFYCHLFKTTVLNAKKKRKEDEAREGPREQRA